MLYIHESACATSKRRSPYQKSHWRSCIYKPRSNLFCSSVSQIQIRGNTTHRELALATSSWITSSVREFPSPVESRSVHHGVLQVRPGVLGRHRLRRGDDDPPQQPVPPPQARLLLLPPPPRRRRRRVTGDRRPGERGVLRRRPGEGEEMPHPKKGRQGGEEGRQIRGVVGLIDSSLMDGSDIQGLV